MITIIKICLSQINNLWSDSLGQSDCQLMSQFVMGKKLPLYVRTNSIIHLNS